MAEARGKFFATDTVVLGMHGEIPAGDEVPAKYRDTLGNEHDTDFDRLEELGVVSRKKPGAGESSGDGDR